MNILIQHFLEFFSYFVEIAPFLLGPFLILVLYVIYSGKNQRIKYERKLNTALIELNGKISENQRLKAQLGRLASVRDEFTGMNQNLLGTQEGLTRNFMDYILVSLEKRIEHEDTEYLRTEINGLWQDFKVLGLEIDEHQKKNFFKTFEKTIQDYEKRETIKAAALAKKEKEKEKLQELQRESNKVIPLFRTTEVFEDSIYQAPPVTSTTSNLRNLEKNNILPFVKSTENQPPRVSEGGGELEWLQRKLAGMKAKLRNMGNSHSNNLPTNNDSLKNKQVS